MKISSNGDMETRDSNCSKLRRKRQQTAEDDRTHGIQPPTTTNHTSSDKIVDSGSSKIGAKRKKELISLTGIREPVVGTRASKSRKMVMEADTIAQGASAKVRTKRNKDERRKGSGEPAIELEKVELYKSNCSELSMLEKKKVEVEKKIVENEKNIVEIEKKKLEIEKKKVEIEKNKVELEKKKVERIIFQDKLARVEETRKRTSEDENATEFWKKKCSNLESLVQRMKNENSTVRCVETRVSDLVTKGDETSNQPATNHNCDSNVITQGASPKVPKNDERTKGSGEHVIELESVEFYKNNCYELSLELEKNKVEFEKMKVELEKNKVELEKKKAACTEFQCILAEVEETRKSTGKDENATEFWRNKCSELESRLQKMDNEISTMRRVESNNMSKRTTSSDIIVGGASATFGIKMKSVERTGKLTKTTVSKRRMMSKEGDQFVDEKSNEPDTSDSCDSTFRTKWRYVVRTGKLKSMTKTTISKQRKMVKEGDQFTDEPSNEPDTSDSCDSDGRKKGSGGWASLEERPSQHGSPSHACPGMSNKNFVNLVSDSDEGGDGLSEPEDSDCFTDSKNSLGDRMALSALKNLKMNNDEMKWKSQADMLSTFEEDTEICMKAVCALYRQVISENEISPKGLVIDEDTRRVGWNRKFSGRLIHDCQIKDLLPSQDFISVVVT